MLFDSMPSKKSAAWKQAEINLDRRVKEENRLRHQREVEKRFKDFAFLSNWQDNVALIAWKSDVKRIQDG
ncbi:hypothetical protein HK098_004142 [Nowakowskiella sp. JEL0407]|nr:hypothetical protein HK098_004142 [Nowakowskiella sp. JEL0407]